MRVVIAGGGEQAQFLVGLLLEKKYKLTVVNADLECCERIAAAFDRVNVIHGDPRREVILDEAGVKGADMVVSLLDKDADNLEVCQMAKRLLEVKKTACTVANPKNVEIFRLLGVDRVVNMACTLAECVV